MSYRVLTGSRSLPGVLSFCLFAVASSWSLSSQAEVSVTNSGSPAYHYPIAVPPGVKGLVPQLALAYTGSNRNGQVGVNWSLSGISAITRCSAIRATDTHHVSPLFAADDKLCLDGERLIPTNASGASPVTGIGTNDAAGLASGSNREYRTEKDSYSRIRAYGYADGTNAASGPLYFRVWTKDGKIIDFGNGPASDANTKATITASYATTQTNHYAQLWAVSRIADIFSNHIDFKYAQRDVTWGSSGSITAGHEWNLSEIQYSGNKVLFSYTDRNGGSVLDGSEAYLSGAKTVVLNRLASITTYINSPNPTTLGPAAGAVAVTTTKLTYSTGPNTGRSLLSSIKTCAGDATSTRCAPATSFNYTSGGDDTYQAVSGFNLANTSMFSGTANSAPFGDKGILTADFDGDGKTDIIIWSATPANNQLWTSNGDGTFTQRTSFNITQSDDMLFTLNGCQQAIVKDFNGDGLVDILRFSSDSLRSGGLACQQSTAQTPRAYLYINNGTGDGSFTRHAITGITPSTFAHDETGGVMLSTYEAFNQSFNGATIWGHGEQFFLADIDGDGILDAITTIHPANYPTLESCPSGGCTRVYKGDGLGGFTSMTTNIGAASLYATAAPLPPGGMALDMDGDGLPDLLYDTYTYRSRGDGNFDSLTSAFTTTNGQVGGVGRTTPLDYNGDGAPDLLYSSSPYGTLAVRDTGSTAYSPVSNFNLDPTGLSNKLNRGPIVLDANGDGKQDILIWDVSGTPTNTLYRSNGDGTFTTSSSFNLNHTILRMPDSGGFGTLITFVMGDFTGHGNAEFLVTNSSGTNTLYVKSNPERPDMLASVTDGNGAQTSFTYVPLPNPTFSGNTLGARYTGDRGTSNAATMPKIDVAPPMYLVATMQSDNGVGGTVKTEFSYYGLKADTTGRDMLGFRAVRKQVVVPTGAVHTSETLAVQDFPYIGAAKNVAVYRAGLNATLSSSNLLSNMVNVYCDQTAATGADTTAIASKSTCPSSAVIRRPYLLWSQSTAKDLGGNTLPTVTTQTAVNADGDPSTVNATKTMTGTSADTYQAITTNGYFTDNISCSDILTCKWILGRVQTTATESIAPSNIFTTSAGTAPYATATQGTSAPGVATIQSNAAFGSHVYNTTIANQSVIIKNTGGGPLTLQASGVTSPFTFVSNTCTNVSPNATCAITYSMANSTIGTFSQTVTLTGSSTGNVTATVSGTVTGSIATLTSSTALAFGTVAQGASSPQKTWTFRNDGNAAMTLSLSSLTSPFSLASNNCTSVAASASCSITVAMSTATQGAFSKTGISVTGVSQGARSDLSASGTVAPAVSDSTTLVNGNTDMFCRGQGARPPATYTLNIDNAAESVTLSMTSSPYLYATPNGWTSGATLQPGQYSFTVGATGSTVATATLTLSFSGTGHVVSETVKSKAGCP